MYLTLSKKFELSSSHRLYRDDLSQEQNFDLFGKESWGEYGHGHNYEAYFIFEGPVDPKTGMMINVTGIKKEIKNHLYPRYDHRYLNSDTKPFDKILPTAENIAARMLAEAIPLFESSSATPVACHLIESENKEATAYSNGQTESHYWIDFSAARVTRSPNLSDTENKKLFGVAANPGGHGHHYRLRITLNGEIDSINGMIFPDKKVNDKLNEIFELFDHKNISVDLPEFQSRPTTTETLAKFIFEKLSGELPLVRIKLYENDNFLIEYNRQDEMTMTVRDIFHAAHRLHSEQLDQSKNIEIFDVCNNLRGHGHNYTLETTISGIYDPHSGTLYDLGELINKVRATLDEYDYKHLNLDTDDFKDLVPTGENIINILWQKLSTKLELSRLRLWETPNNRFTLRNNH